MQGAVDFTPVLLPPARSEVIHVTRQIAPQGWAFFTKDAQSEFIVPYVLNEGKLVNRSIPVGASATWALGFDRSGRAQGAEIATFLQGVGHARWRPCRSERACQEVAGGDSSQVKNAWSTPSLCGEVLLIARKPVPWQWRTLRTDPLPQEAILLDVVC